MIVVRDNGIGFSAETHEKLFQFLFQGDQSGCVSNGLGIGLALTHALWRYIGAQFRRPAQDRDGAANFASGYH